MNRLLLFLILLFGLRSLSQTTPPQYPYPDPLPTTGSTPGTTIKVTQVLNPTGYADNRPVIWDDFVGGGFRSVGTTNERNSILSGRRKEGMMVMVKSVTGDTNLFGLYMLLKGIGNTNWYKLADITTTNGFLLPALNSINIGNSDLTLTGDRFLSGAATRGLGMAGLTYFTVGAENVSILGTEATLTGGNILELNSNIEYRLTSPNIYTVSSNIINNVAANGWVWTVVDSVSGYGEWKPASGGDNIYNIDGSLTGNRVLDGTGSSFNLRFQNIGTFHVATGTDINLLAGNSAHLTTTPNSVDVETTTLTLSISTNSLLRLRTPSVNAGTAVTGQFLQLLDAGSGWVDFTNSVGTGSGSQTTINVTADNQVVDPNSYSLIRLHSDNLTASSRTIKLSAPTSIGHMVSLVAVGVDGLVELPNVSAVDGGPGFVYLGAYDWSSTHLNEAINLVSDGTNWIARSRQVFPDLIYGSGGQTNWGILTLDPGFGLARSTGITISDIRFPRTYVPTVAAGSGAGTGPTVTLANQTDSAFTLNVTAGTTPSVSADIAVITFGAAYATAPHFYVSPGNVATATLAGATGVWGTSTTTTFTLHSNLTGLVGTTNYVWEILTVK